MPVVEVSTQRIEDTTRRFVWAGLGADDSGQVAQLDRNTYSMVQVTGSFSTAVVYIEGSIDNTNWTVLQEYQREGLRSLPGSFLYVRPRVSDSGSPNITVTMVSRLGHPAEWKGTVASRVARLPSSAASTNATVAKDGPGMVLFVFGYNSAEAPVYLRFYDTATAPTVGTDPIALGPLALPPKAGFAFHIPSGFIFEEGISYSLTAGSADNDTTAVAAADVTGLNIGIA